MNTTLNNQANPTPLSVTITGQCGYRINGKHVSINVEEIANQRDADNLSGSLALELWALPRPYNGAHFTGVALASTQLDEVQGQYCLRDCLYELDFQPPPAGTWTVVLMLREWDNDAFITRDYVNFSTPYLVVGREEYKPSIVRKEKDNVISVSFRDMPEATADNSITKINSEKKPEENTGENPETMQQLASEELDCPVASAETYGSIELLAVDESSKEKAASHKLSLNTAMFSELAALKGVSRALAKSIYDSRPYKTLDDLLSVKGIGKKMFERIKGKIEL